MRDYTDPSEPASAPGAPPDDDVAARFDSYASLAIELLALGPQPAFTPLQEALLQEARAEVAADPSIVPDQDADLRRQLAIDAKGYWFLVGPEAAPEMIRQTAQELARTAARRRAKREARQARRPVVRPVRSLRARGRTPRPVRRATRATRRATAPPGSEDSPAPSGGRGPHPDLDAQLRAGRAP